MIDRRQLDTLPADELLRMGIAAARVGEHDEAKLYLDEVVRREPANADAWLWLAGVEAKPQAKRAHFERVLELRPGDDEAQAGLERLAAKYGRGLLVDDTADEAVMVCTWHPDRETMLRCNRCERPMCPECARRHPVGLRCKACMKELRSPIYVVSTGRYVLAGLTGLLMSTAVAAGVTLFLGGYLGLLGGIFGIFIAFFVGAGLGTTIAEAVSVAAGRKRGRGLQVLTGATMILGALIVVLVLGLLRGHLGAGFNLALVVYLFVGIGAASTRLQ